MTADTTKRKENIFEKMIKCCIFDLDGTLLNTLGTITHYINKTLAEFGHSAITEADCRRFVGNGPELLIRRSLAHVGVSDENEVQRVLLRYKDNYAAEPLYLTEAYNGIPELLLRLKDAGIYTAVLSNKQDDATALTARHFFGDNLDIARGSREGVALKPAPDAIFEQFKTLLPVIRPAILHPERSSLSSTSIAEFAISSPYSKPETEMLSKTACEELLST